MGITSVSPDIVIRSLPIIVWCTAYGVTAFSPAWLKFLSMVFPLLPTPPSKQLREDFEHSTGADEPYTGGPQASEGFLLQQLFLYPFRWLYYSLSIAKLLVHSENEGQGGGGGRREGNNAPSISFFGRHAKVLRLFTSLFVHPDRTTLLNSIGTYIYGSTMGKHVWGRWQEALEDLVFSLLGAALGNYIMSWRIHAISSLGMILPGVHQYVKQQSVVTQGAAFALAAALPFLRIIATFVARATVMVRLQSINLRLGGRSSPNVASVNPTADENAAAATNMEQRTAQGEEEEPLGLSYAYLCGGEGTGYALSGFRLVYHREWDQLTGSAWGLFLDGAEIFLNQTSYVSSRRRYRRNARLVRLQRMLEEAIQNQRYGEHDGDDGEGNAPERAAPAPVMDTAQVGIPDGVFSLNDGSGDYVFTAASTLSLQLSNVASFVGGMAMGFAYMGAIRSIPYLYKLPITAQILHLVRPLPPPKIDIPDELYYATRPELASVRIYRDHRCTSSSSSGEEEWETASSGAEEGDREEEQARAAHVPRSQLRPHLDYEDIVVPPECFCAITRALMYDPVSTCDGFTYDREAITEWLHHQRLTSPMTNLPLQHDRLRPNFVVREAIEKIVSEYNAIQQRWAEEQ